MAGTEHERRRFVTRHDVDDAAAAGHAIRLHGRDVLTAEAADRASKLEVSVEREEGASRPTRSAPSRTQPASPEDLRRAVRAAVVAELGSEPEGLDAAIERVLERRDPRATPGRSTPR